MRLMTKWLLVSIGGGFLVTAVLFVLPSSFLISPESKLHPIGEEIVQAVLWPVTVCVYLSGPGPAIGPPEKHMHEGTPVQILAAMIGIGLTWTFYSSLAFLILWLRRRQRLLPKTTSIA